ncbi:hypothetical protein B0H10DRAFT_1961741 [Mycena sp. CBHHK59/15]|nr:hypothetical protein B0H10DRAFT_1961741 [Mycena sp. CBHHK59/15]
MFAVLCEAFFQFVSSRGLKVEEYYRKASNASAKIDEDDDVDVDFSMNASLDQQLRYVETLRNHGRSRTHHPQKLKQLEDEYCSLPKMLRPLKLLFLKPIHLLTPKESAELVEITGLSENPISVYFSQSRFSKPFLTHLDKQAYNVVKHLSGEDGDPDWIHVDHTVPPYTVTGVRITVPYG